MINLCIIPVYTVLLISTATAATSETADYAVRAFLSPEAGMNDVLDLTQRFAAAEAIDALADALEHNPAFVENTRARRLAFDAMVRIGESDQSGRLIYRRLAQARVILRALDDHDPAALGAVVRRSYLLDPKALLNNTSFPEHSP